MKCFVFMMSFVEFVERRVVKNFCYGFWESINMRFWFWIGIGGFGMYFYGVVNIY